MIRVDVAVVGGGPAGATAARLLARAGLRVRLFEKEPLPRYKTCGGGLVGRARRWLEIDLAPVIESDCRTAQMRFLEDGPCFALEPGEPVVTMTMRADLDRALVESAAREGVEVRSPCAVRGLESGREEVVLDTADGPIAARHVIAADGAAGPIARWAGWRRHRRWAVALESEVRVDAATMSRFAGRALFDFGIVPHGYAWVFPKREHLSVGCLTTAPRAHEIRAGLDAYVERLGLVPRAREDHGFVIPLAPRAPELARGGVLLCGDSAGLADPVTAEGISYAALSARLAARAILDGAGDRRATARRYHRLLRREILSELAIARPLARLLYHRPRVMGFLLRRAGEPLCRAMGEVLAGHTTYRRLARSPASYLGLLRRLAAHQLMR